MTHGDDHITVYSDYVCPFCYLGKQSLKTFQDGRDEAVPVEWHPYDLRSYKRGPDGELDQSMDMSKSDSYMDQVREKVTRLQDTLDADEMLSLDERPENVDSFDAQVASVYVDAEHPDQWAAFDDALFEALWVDGRAIGDGDVLAALADDVGLDGAEIRTAVTDEQRRDQVLDLFAAAEERGVSGVPTFSAGETTTSGVASPDELAALVDGV